MLISIHLPKTAGSSLGTTLKEWFGNRLLLDYGDLIGDESAQSMAHRAKRKTAMLGKVSEISTAFDAIHGHFYADKYFEALPSADFAVLMRDPFSRIPSYYEYLKRCHHHRNPLVVAIRKSEMSLDTFIRWDYMRNLCSRLLYPLNVEQLWFGSEGACPEIGPNIKRNVAFFFEIRHGYAVQNESFYVVERVCFLDERNGIWVRFDNHDL